MLWVALWTALVVGTLVGAFFLGRSLYRSAKALAHELERAADAAGAIADRIEALEATGSSATRPAPVELLDPEPARLRMAEVELRRLARRLRRADRRARTHERWESFVR